MGKHIYGCAINELEEYFLGINEKKYRAIQTYEWLYQKKVFSFDEMTNIKHDLREALKKDFKIKTINLIRVQKGSDVAKYLYELKDKNTIEAVLMKHSYGNSLCISTQVGCNIGCLFCESGRLKKVRNLLPGEMVEQIIMAEEEVHEKISHVVLMGIGEPFDNYENVVKFLKIINHHKSLNIGTRHITLSTAGVVPRINDFANEEGQVNLAISLHAPNNEIRNKIMPINKSYNIEKLLEACKNYIKRTNRRITFEYILLDGINDSDDCAVELSKRLKGINCYVNLIPYNEASNTVFKKSGKAVILRFYDILKKNKINVTIRKEFGGQIDAACGQLRADNR
ncbi:MAG: 23S rRNA (adenine(2503)-C(2))-methyltransferase RlmN [Firmicutes bacterium]|nr:23S rRNA (adenine(2503)-C(2))-methyltransferase RlmN [Bacillota bacterium]